MSSITFLSATLFLVAAASESYQYCLSIEPPEHGFVKINEYYRKYEFSCEGGYILQGQSFINCYEHDVEKLRPKCIKYECEDLPNPQNGQVECDEGPLVPGKNCRFSCFNGYELQDSSTTMCKFNLQWSRSAKCIPISRISTSSTEICENPSPPESGEVECEKGDLTLGKSCRFSCFKGYKLQGVEVTRCMPNNRWSGSVKCVPLPEYAYSEPADDNRRVHQKTSVSNSNHLTENYNSVSDDTKRNACQNLSCQQLCLAEKAGFHCRCCPGYILNTDNQTCSLKNHQRVNMIGCLHRYKKVGDVELRQGCIFDHKKNSCIESPHRPAVPSSPTSFESCSVRNGGCQHKCRTTASQTVACACRNGYKLQPDGKHCTEKSPHRPSVPSSPTSFESCSVRNGGCDHDCKMTASQTITCACRNGYQLHPDGKQCIDVNECRTDNFGCTHLCVNYVGSAYCVCPNGFTLHTDKKTCIDIDECLDDNRCDHHCINTIGSYFCKCKPSYILIEGYKCEGCRRNSYWSYEKDACVDCPRNSHTDSEGKTYLSDCICNSGYTGSPGDYVTCEDIDECRVGNFGCSDTCINTPGGVYCICPKGFMLDTDNKTCIDIDECSTKNGGCEGLCINTNGSFRCICGEGFTTSKKDHYSCDDIDECSENNGGCEHQCVNYRGGFYCACEAGYHLDSNLKNCTDIQCPKLALPHYSHMECTLRNESLPEKNTYPVGTVCSFKCNKGFKNTQDDNKMKCRQDRNWKGMLPECKPQSCPPLKVPENGEIHPSSCSKYGAAVKQKCTFSCHAGYILDGFPVLMCKNNLAWTKKNIQVCKLVKIQPVIKCPEDIKVTLSQGEATHNITIPEPSTNMETYEVHPSWVTVNEPTEFPVGATQITFITYSSFNETAQCEMTVTVLDEEPPVFNFCPDPIAIEGAKGSGEFVTWDEPVVTDNVELVSVFSILEPNTTLAPGTYFVEYVARDSSGNIGTCSFEISIIRMNCTDLRDPVHGKANCMDWMYGKLCNPECDDGYIRDPNDPLYYSCDDTGLWEPNESISECLQYYLATSTTCQDGFELKKVDVTGEEVCIECPSNAVWSSTTRTCVK